MPTNLRLSSNDEELFFQFSGIKINDKHVSSSLSIRYLLLFSGKEVGFYFDFDKEKIFIDHQNDCIKFSLPLNTLLPSIKIHFPIPPAVYLRIIVRWRDTEGNCNETFDIPIHDFYSDFKK